MTLRKRLFENTVSKEEDSAAQNFFFTPNVFYPIKDKSCYMSNIQFYYLQKLFSW